MQEELQKFLIRINGSTEPCLIIAKDEQGLIAIENEVSNFGFQKTKDIVEILNAIKNGNKIYFTLGKTLESSMYNIFTQYPTGQVTIYDGQKNFVVSPDYGNGAILILITKENLEKIEKSERNLLRIVGLTHASILSKIS